MFGFGCVAFSALGCDSCQLIRGFHLARSDTLGFHVGWSLVFPWCLYAVLCTSLPCGIDCSNAFCGGRSACLVCRLVGRNNRSVIVGGHILDHCRPMDSAPILHPFLKLLEIVHLTLVRQFEFPDCLMDETFHQFLGIFFLVRGKISSDDFDIIVQCGFQVFVKIAIRAVAHAHHHIESVCMVKQTQHVSKATLLVNREWL